MLLICYGEDGLSLSALTDRLSDLLRLLNDQTAPADCSVLFRPSFGRRGGQTRAPFGEFDGILATRKRIYLIESKWIRSRIRDGTVKMKPNQVLRHQIFEWLWERWSVQRTWRDFVADFGADFSQEFNGKPLAPCGSALASNIEHVLNLLTEWPRTIEHILLAFYRDPRQNPEQSG